MKALRKAIGRKVSQTDFASLFPDGQVSRATVAKWETGYREPKDYHIEHAAHFSGRSYALMTGWFDDGRTTPVPGLSVGSPMSPEYGVIRPLPMDAAIVAELWSHLDDEMLVAVASAYMKQHLPDVVAELPVEKAVVVLKALEPTDAARVSERIAQIKAAV